MVKMKKTALFHGKIKMYAVFCVIHRYFTVFRGTFLQCKKRLFLRYQNEKEIKNVKKSTRYYCQPSPMII